MTQPGVSAVRSVDLAVTGLKAATDFFTGIWGLKVIAIQNGAVYLRATGSEFYALGLHQASSPAIIRILLQARDRTMTDQLYDRLTQSGTPIDGPPRRLARPGGGYGFGFQDPENRNFAIVSDIADYSATAPKDDDLPTRISHVNLNCRDNDATFRFFADVLDFHLSDQTNGFRFVRCGADHHALVFGFNDNCFLNHIAFEMPSLESVMRGIGRMRDNGYPVEWGPGRHGPGNNVFAYFCGPEEVPVEYTAEMQQVDDSYRVGMPSDWTWPPGRLDQWGITPGPSARVKNAQRHFAFSPRGYWLEQEGSV